jgi:entry exclusion lipoprotein TrbK
MGLSGMKKIFLAAFIAAALLSLSACNKADDQAAPTGPVASPACADLPNVTDPAQRAELQKKCPRSGPAFKPSPAKSY